jgi:hypothetical protein
MVWTDNGPQGACGVCKGEGVVSLSTWIRYTFETASDED